VVVGDGGMLEGLISTSDIARARAVNAGMGDAPRIFPAHLMTSQVLVTWPEEPLQTAVERMLSHHVHRLVVVKSQQEPAVPVGILSMTDLARTHTQAE
jgi:CBS domain-containing protein